MSRERTPVLSGALSSLELVMSAWERCHLKHPRAAAVKAYADIGVEWATKYYRKMDDTDAYVVAMCT